MRVFAKPSVRSYIANHDRKKPVRARLSAYRVTNTRKKKMFAVIKTGGKQYRVVAEDVLRIDRVEAEPGSVIEFGEVLVVGGDSTMLGAPTVEGAAVAAEVLDHVRGPKVIAFKKRRRKNSRRKRGHRQEFSLVRITEILTEGKKPSPTPPPRPKRAPKVEGATAEGATGEGDASNAA
jgi:large subunit ribosomal protein L21